jgi:hypothetical protein
MGDSIVLVFTENDEALVRKWVKRVCDSDFACQNSGIMNCLPMPADNVRRPFTACSVLPSLTMSPQNSICAMSGTHRRSFGCPHPPTAALELGLPASSASCITSSVRLKIDGHLNPTLKPPLIKTALKRRLPPPRLRITASRDRSLDIIATVLQTAPTREKQSI